MPFQLKAFSLLTINHARAQVLLPQSNLFKFAVTHALNLDYNWYKSRKLSKKKKKKNPKEWYRSNIKLEREINACIYHNFRVAFKQEELEINLLPKRMHSKINACIYFLRFQTCLFISPFYFASLSINTLPHSHKFSYLLVCPSLVQASIR